MRYFLDTEYNGTGGQLLSVALVPDHGDQEFYATFPLPADIHPWVAAHVIPYLSMVPQGLREEMTPLEAGAEISRYLAHDPAPEIVADWPDDIAYFCGLLVTGPGDIVDIPSLTFRLLRTPGFSTAANSKVPHNALHDARSLRDFAAGEAGLDVY
ncbi:MAG: hypothetical protein QHC40_05640 [Sphingobium sp.]|nr:hypothetical protein [Sphingobium sp.]